MGHHTQITVFSWFFHTDVVVVYSFLLFCMIIQYIALSEWLGKVEVFTDTSNSAANIHIHASWCGCEEIFNSWTINYDRAVLPGNVKAFVSLSGFTDFTFIAFLI